MNDENRVYVVTKHTRKGDTYHLRWVCPRAQRWRSQKVGTDKKRATRAAAELEIELTRGTYRDTRRVSWSDFVTEHVSNIAGTANRVDTERTLQSFADVCNPAGPHAVTYVMVEAFATSLRERGNAVPTINKRLRYLRAAFNKAVARGYIGRNPMQGWQWAREELRVPRALSADEKSKLIDACPSTQWRSFVVVALLTGCRRGELLGLTWDRVKLDAAEIVITHTKGKRDRVQPLTAEAVDALRELQASTIRDGGPFRSMNANTMPEQFRAIVTAAGVAPCTVHDLRRTFATDLARAGVPQFVTQTLCGHASPSTTAKYYIAVDDAMKRDALARVLRGAG